MSTVNKKFTGLLPGMPGYGDEEEGALMRATNALYDEQNSSNLLSGIKNFGNWLVGTKESSPLGYGLSIGNSVLNYLNAKDSLNFQKQQHQDQMSFARYNALADINADMANANMQLLRWAGFNPERSSEYANSFVNSFQDVVKAAEGIGTDLYLHCP